MEWFPQQEQDTGYDSLAFLLCHHGILGTTLHRYVHFTLEVFLSTLYKT
jgi:hypothetical protein